MRKNLIISLLVMMAFTVILALNEANAGFPFPPGLPAPPNVNVRLDGYLPTPPGVNIQFDTGRPYYVERDRRIYIEKERPSKHHNKRHYKKYKRHHE